MISPLYYRLSNLSYFPPARPLAHDKQNKTRKTKGCNSSKSIIKQNIGDFVFTLPSNFTSIILIIILCCSHFRPGKPIQKQNKKCTDHIISYPNKHKHGGFGSKFGLVGCVSPAWNVAFLVLILRRVGFAGRQPSIVLGAFHVEWNTPTLDLKIILPYMCRIGAVGWYSTI